MHSGGNATDNDDYRRKDDDTQQHGQDTELGVAEETRHVCLHIPDNVANDRDKHHGQQRKLRQAVYMLGGKTLLIILAAALLALVLCCQLGNHAILAGV